LKTKGKKRKKDSINKLKEALNISRRESRNPDPPDRLVSLG